jgi:hypothetical protein
MRPEATHNRHRDLASFALAVIAVLLGALVIAKAASYFQVQRIAAQVRGLGRQDPNDLRESLHEAKATADALKKSNLFIKAPPKQHPVKQVDGILGSEVLIGQKWYKVGDKVGDAKIVAISSTSVTVEWDGKEKTFAPIAGASAEPPATPAVAEAKAEKPPEPTKTQAQTPPAEVKVAAAPAQPEDPFAWVGMEIPPRLREKLLEQWSKLSPEQQEEAKRQWTRMSPEEKKENIDRMEREFR